MLSLFPRTYPHPQIPLVTSGEACTPTALNPESERDSTEHGAHSPKDYRHTIFLGSLLGEHITFLCVRSKTNVFRRWRGRAHIQCTHLGKQWQIDFFNYTSNKSYTRDGFQSVRVTGIVYEC